MKDFTSGFADLHNHLYGSIRPELLWEIGRSNPSPRWEIFTIPYEQLYGRKIRPETFFSDFQDSKAFRDLYLFNHSGPFLEFQAKFNLIIALSQFNPQEIRFISERVVLDQYEDGVTFGEYRIMYSEKETYEGIYEKTLAACEGLQKAESTLKEKARGRLVISLHRDGDVFREYEVVKSIMEKSSLIKEYLVGLDFCYIEEGFPPKDKKEFLELVNRDNLAESSTALAVLYHVGESFQDKSLVSASRWILQSAEFGAHRLGHAIALGIEPMSFLGQTIVESAQELRDTLEFLYERRDEISDYCELQTREKIGLEIDSIRHKEKVELYQDEESLLISKGFQNYCMDSILDQKAVIESCPSSNEYIGMVKDIGHHPLLRFFQKGMRMTISTDDPGIFGTSMKNEYNKAETIGVSPEFLEEIRKDSFQYTSEILSGRARQ
ncbi:adenosine deaminase [Leptospira perolatii]|uniref:adenosine deaminase n=2 Tax=Leptospira perolatii TaxID=2023191 RepID=A0A2M9ZSX3_9LEPT|nr:adenosine deaminase [Leptospira perolatii]PJZ75207.1 adenosine deaminase [Leptospira perolatii]